MWATRSVRHVLLRRGALLFETTTLERERERGSVRKNFYVVSLISAELVRIKWNWTEFIGSIDNTRFSFFEGEYGRNGRRYFFFEKTSTTTTPSPAGRWSDAHPCRGREARSGVVLRDRYTCLSLSLSLFGESCLYVL